jgi:hypothetical protein
MYIVNLASSGILMSVVCVTPTLLQVENKQNKKWRDSISHQ